MMDSDYGANYTALIQSMRNLGKIGKKPPTDLEKLSEAVKHLSSFQRLVEDCSSTLFIKVNGVEVTATNKVCSRIMHNTYSYLRVKRLETSSQGLSKFVATFVICVGESARDRA